MEIVKNHITDELGIEHRSFSVMSGETLLKEFKESDYGDNNCDFMMAYADAQNYISLNS